MLVYIDLTAMAIVVVIIRATVQLNIVTQCSVVNITVNSHI